MCIFSWCVFFHGSKGYPLLVCGELLGVLSFRQHRKSPESTVEPQDDKCNILMVVAKQKALQTVGCYIVCLHKCGGLAWESTTIGTSLEGCGGANTLSCILSGAPLSWGIFIHSSSHRSIGQYLVAFLRCKHVNFSHAEFVATYLGWRPLRMPKEASLNLQINQNKVNLRGRNSPPYVIF